MLLRFATGIIGIILAVILIFYPGGLPFAVAVGLVSILGAHEFYDGVRKVGGRPIEPAGLIAVALFVVSMRTYQPDKIGSIFPAVLTLLLILSFIVELARNNRAPLVNVSTTVFGAIYVGWLISHLVVLRGIGSDNMKICSYTSEPGALLVMFTFLCTWACDTGAFMVGKFFGKKKLAPMLSPNKTIEGALGGLASTLVVALIFGWVIKLPLHHALALGIIFGTLSQVGDLSESALKREIGIKDFGSIMPGHGGILDRFDSILFTGPVAYYYAVLFLQQWPK